MTSLNTITLIGRILNDPDVKVTSNGTPFAKFTIGVDRPTSASTGTTAQDSIFVVCWGDSSDIVKAQCQKGSLILVQGRISERTYEDDNGQRHWVTEVDCRQVTPLSSADSSSTEEAAVSLNVVPGPVTKDSDFNFSDPFQSNGDSSESVSGDPVEEEVPF